MENKKVVLISQPCSGTHLFRGFLNSHPNIEFAGEILDKCQFEESEKNVKEYLDDFFNQDKKVVGFDCKYHHFTDESNTDNDFLKSSQEYTDSVREYLKRNEDILIVHLIRNPGRSLLFYLSEETKQITYKQMIEHRQRVHKKIEWTRINFKKTHPFLEIHYEDMTRGKEITELPKDFEKRILAFLQVPYRRLNIKNYKKNKEKWYTKRY